MARMGTTLAVAAALAATGCGAGGSATEDACLHARDAVSAIRARDFEAVPEYLRSMAEDANRGDASDLRVAVQEVRVQYENWTQQTAGTTDAQFASKWVAEALAELDSECAAVGVSISE